MRIADALARVTPAQRRWAVTLAALLVLAVRRWDVIVNPQLWAEDGGLFLVDADTLGWKALSQPYAGYLHLLPRLIALLGSGLPMLWIPSFYTLCCLGVTGAVVWYVQSPRVPLPATIVLAFAIVAVPHTGEVYLAICNLQWITAIALLVLCLIRPPATRAARVGDALVLAGFGLTGPFIVLILPLLALRLARERTRWQAQILGLALLTTALQVPSILHRGAGDPTPPMDWTLLLAFCSRRILLQPFLGPHVLTVGWALGLGAVFLGLLAASLWRRRRELPAAWLPGWFSVLVVAAITVKSRPDTWGFDDLANGDRYFFIPRILLLWVLAALVSRTRGAAFNLGVALLLVPLLVNLRPFIVPPAPPQHWADYARRIEYGHRTVAPIRPDGFTLTHPGRQRAP